MNFSEFAIRDCKFEENDEGPELKSSFGTAPSSPIDFAKPVLLNYPSGLFQEISADYGELSAIVENPVDIQFSIIEKNSAMDDMFERNDEIVLCENTNTNDISIDEKIIETIPCNPHLQIPALSEQSANILLDTKETYEGCII
jgi:hypothetical protein